jgi:pimeloyl-ACP methyl ester carboxylesterase
VRFLARHDGRIAYTLEGTGPLVVAVPGMGDLRSTFRELTGPLLNAGYRVAVMDLRGHGSSDTGFHTHGDAVTGGDLLALIDELGGPAMVLGNSMGAASAAWAAAERPAAIAGLVLYGPLLREPVASARTKAANRLLYRLLFSGPWGAAAWTAFYRSINRGAKAPWLEQHLRDIRANLREPGRLRSFRELAVQLDHSIVEARLPQVTAPLRAFIGDRDPDFKDPVAESAWISGFGGQCEIVPDAGHYPQAQRPDIVVPATLAFLAAHRDSQQGTWAAHA